MLNRIITYLVLFPLFLVLLAFVFLNRHGVTLYINPLEFGAVPAELFLPLGVIIILSVFLGALLGGIIVKLSSMKRMRGLRKEISVHKVRVNSELNTPPAPPLSLP